MNKAFELIGWYGISAILLAYGLLNFHLISLDHPLYILLNLTGSFAIAYHSFKKKDYQPAILNIVWLLIAVFSLFRVANFPF